MSKRVSPGGDGDKMQDLRLIDAPLWFLVGMGTQKERFDVCQNKIDHVQKNMCAQFTQVEERQTDVDKRIAKMEELSSSLKQLAEPKIVQGLFDEASEASGSSRRNNVSLSSTTRSSGRSLDEKMNKTFVFFGWDSHAEKVERREDMKKLQELMAKSQVAQVRVVSDYVLEKISYGEERSWQCKFICTDVQSMWAVVIWYNVLPASPSDVLAPPLEDATMNDEDDTEKKEILLKVKFVDEQVLKMKRDKPWNVRRMDGLFGSYWEHCDKAQLPALKAPGWDDHRRFSKTSSMKRAALFLEIIEPASFKDKAGAIWNKSLFAKILCLGEVQTAEKIKAIDDDDVDKSREASIDRMRSDTRYFGQR